MYHYYLIQWDHDLDDEPYRLFLELDSSKRIHRKVEVYSIGIIEAFEDVDEPPISLYELAGDGTVMELTYPQFEEQWARAREMPSGFMDIYF